MWQCAPAKARLRTGSRVFRLARAGAWTLAAPFYHYKDVRAVRGRVFDSTPHKSLLRVRRALLADPYSRSLAAAGCGKALSMLDLRTWRLESWTAVTRRRS